MNIVYLIGNGFDLNLGMKTKYSDFYEYYTALPTGNDADIVKKFKKEVGKNIDKWSDLELELGKYLDDKMELQDAVTLHEHLIECLRKYLEKEEAKYVINKSSDTFFNYLHTPHLNGWLLPNDDEELKAYMSKNITYEKWDIKVITFNYTRTIERLLGNDMSTSIDGVTHSIGLEHIHGFTNKRLILGVNDTYQIENETLSKEMRVINRYIKTNCIQTFRIGIEQTCQQWINDADLICLFGLSFGDTDKRWWELIVKKLQGDSRTIIFEHCQRELGGNEGAARLEIEEAAKERLLSKTEISKDPVKKKLLEKNIYVACNTDMFKFKIDKIKRKKLWPIIGIAIGLMFCLAIGIFIWFRQGQQKPTDTSTIDTVTSGDTSIQPPQITVVPTPADTPTLASVPPQPRPTQQTKTTITMDPKKSDSAYEQALRYEDINIDRAVEIYNANARAFPRDARNFVRLGMIYGQKRETLPQAWENLNSAVKLTDNDPDIWLLLAQVSGKLGKADAELSAYKKYSTLKPQDLKVTRRIGELLYEKKQYAEAITNLEMFLTTNDKDVKVLLMLADAYDATNRPQKTTELLTKAKNLTGDDPDVRERLYKTYKRESKKELADAEIRELADITKSSKHRLMLYGDLVEAGKLDEAAAVANAVRKSDPTNFEGLMALASIQRLQKKYEDAIETYKLVLFANGDYAPACAGRAEAHLMLAEYDRAETFYMKALKLDPNMASAELGLSKVYKATKRKDLQIQHLNRAKRLDPNNKAVLDELKQFESSGGRL
jgi:tetratricopeptide (TPR) repeat protein